jgi:glycosyltransferase involved in cell wall biosynthesis/Flp pilus assembly protein TadD
MDDRQRQAIQEIIERQQKGYQHQITGLQTQLRNLQEYLNLFLNHPIYKIFKFFKKDALKKHTKDINGLLNEGDDLFSKADLEGADERYRAAVHHSDYSERAVSSLVRLLQARGEFDEAQEIARNALQQNPESLIFHSQLADSYLTTGTFWEAERLFRKIIEKWPQNLQAWSGLADLAIADAKYVEAFSIYNQILQLQPENLTALSGISECSLYLPQVKKQIEQLKEERYSEKPLILSILQPRKSSAERQPSSQKSNEHILFVDEYFPMFDRNSGNHRAYQFIQLIHQHYPITFLARNGEYQTRYKQELQKMGIETCAVNRNELAAKDYTSPSMLKWWSDFIKRRHFRLAILSRFKTAHTFMPLIRAFSPETKIILDTVDVHFLREQRKANLYGAQPMYEYASETKELELETCNKADGLIAVTDEDAAVLRKEVGSEKAIKVIPNIHPVQKKIAPFKERRDLLFIGNFAHPPNSDAVYYFCGQILPSILKKLPDLYLYIVGGNSSSLLQNLASDRIILTGYVPSTRPFLNHCRLSVNPLRYGAGMKGKIGEAMAHGLPVISTTIGAEGFHIQNGNDALIADTPEQFSEAVFHAYTNENLWNTLSKNGLRKVAESYTPEAVAPLVTSLLKS